MDEEQHILDRIEQTLSETNEYDGVFVGALADRKGESADMLRSVFIEPGSTQETTLSDAQTAGMIERTFLINFTFAARYQEPKERDRVCSKLRAVASSELDGERLAGLVVPGMTRFISWNWQPPDSSERQIKAVFRAVYLVDGWDTLE